MIRTYKYRLRPTNKQRYALDDVLFQMQTVYNDALNERRWYWSRSRRSLSYFDQWNRFKGERYRYPEQMGLLNVTSIQQTLRRLDKAYNAFYKGLRGLPRFKGRNRFKSVEYRYGDGCKLVNDRLYIQHVGHIRVRLHRDIPPDAKIKRVVLKKTNGNWDVCLMLELPEFQTVQSGFAVGIDIGIKSLLALSDGTLIDNPHWLRASLARKRVLNRQLARRRRFSRGWRETKRKLARLDEHIASKRKDFWHKLTTDLANRYGVIALEEMNLTFMLRNRSLSLSAHDASLGMFRTMLAGKVEKTGSQIIFVNPRNTSQTCSGCGSIVKKELHVRVHCCPDCDLSLDRDVNAARNILWLGRSQLALTCPTGESVAREAPSL